MEDAIESSPSEPLQRFDSLAEPFAKAIEAIDRQVAGFADRLRRGSILPNSMEAFRIKLTYHSNAIEGNTLSLRQTQLVIEGHSPGEERSLREIYEARNHDQALRLIERWARDRGARDPGAIPLTETDLLEVHGAVLRDITPNDAGRLRSERVLIAGTGFVPPGSHRFETLMPELLALANRPAVHPLIQAAELHYNLVAVHPFTDGNGRTARLLMNHHLLQRGYPCVIVEVNRRGDYLASLDEANHGRIEPFFRLMVSGLDKTLELLQ